MAKKPRIESIFKAEGLESSITGFPDFNLSSLEIKELLYFDLPDNLRLGHLAERVFSGLVNASSNYEILEENLQLILDKRTVGELDFILRDIRKNQVIHLELAYKFYLLDPNISTDSLNNWIGPNRNDSLELKLKKLKERQFPLLNHSCLKSHFSSYERSSISQLLCFLASLYVPFGFKQELDSSFQKAIKGYYLNFEAFLAENTTSKNYQIPAKKDWGINPFENNEWIAFDAAKAKILKSIEEKQSVLVWQKEGDAYSEFFVVWW